MNNQKMFGWIDFYIKLADKILPYADDRKTLLEKIKTVFQCAKMRMPKLDEDQLGDIDPFTVFGLFNRGITSVNRTAILRGFAQEFSVDAPVPETFDGIPVLNNMAATFYYFGNDRQNDDIPNLWRVFASAIAYAETNSEASKNAFVQAYDACLQQKGVKWNLTMGLYWIRPYDFINLDSRNRWYISRPENMLTEIFSGVEKIDTVPTGEEYLMICDRCRALFEKCESSYKSFPDLSYAAWMSSEQVNKEKQSQIIGNMRTEAGAAIGDKDVHTVHYWLYSPGYGSEMWEEFYNEGIMGIAREYIGDLSQYTSKKEMQDRMKESGEAHEWSYSMAALETWQFAYEIKPGDVIFAKSGKKTVIGRGIVVSEYIYDESRPGSYKNIRRVRWTHKGEWEHPGLAVTKVLTDITDYVEYVAKLSALFEDDGEEPPEKPHTEQPVYTSKDFLGEVYMNSSDYDILTNLLRNKKNIILQGPPGVGKTYVAKRLAYSMMGLKDPERVMMVQFHQSYCYEDFIMGYRPTATGFTLSEGPFYQFCAKARADRENEYFFIIDEINRGNLSKIFGELFMLIEKDKRDASLRLLYSNENFSVPGNLYIIGMMNTADRSLAFLDYALRRRFAFYEFAPAFASEGFCAYVASKGNEKFGRLIHAIEALNVQISEDETLGTGFQIGHSYFCTDQEIDDLWLNAVVVYEIVPLLREYWFDEPTKVSHWDKVLREAIK